jgi:ATP-dependent protease Clp ATPase subunit
MLDVMYDLPSRANVKECIISEDVVEQRQAADPGLRERGRVGLID